MSVKPNEVSVLFFEKVCFVRFKSSGNFIFELCGAFLYHQVLCHACSFCFASTSRLVHILGDSFSLRLYFVFQSFVLMREPHELIKKASAAFAYTSFS